MLNISKPLSASQAQTYHAKEFTSAEQNYWQQKGATLGEWHGELAKRFGLAGAVSADDFARLAQGQHPVTGDQLVSHRVVHEYQGQDGKIISPVEHRAGWDATFSAPKSVSLTALVGHDDRVRDAHCEAVNFALSELERFTQARIGGNHPAETTGKFVAATFEHDIRQKDPELLKAFEHLSRHETAAGIAILQQHGSVTQIAEPQARFEAIAKSYALQPGNTLIVSPDNASRREINEAVRQKLKTHSVVDAIDHQFTVLTPRSDMTGADRRWASRYEVGDILR